MPKRDVADRRIANDGSRPPRAPRRVPAKTFLVWAGGALLCLLAVASLVASRHIAEWLEIRRERAALDDVIAAVGRDGSVANRVDCVERCAAELGRLVGRYPASPDVFAALARFHGRFGRGSDCTRCWRRCMALDPLSAAMAHQAIGSRALADGDFRDAASDFRASLRAAPGQFDVQVCLAEALLGDGAPEEALEVLDEALREHGRSLPALALQGQAYAQLRRHADARAAFEGAIELGPDYPAAHHGLAVAASRLGDGATAARFRESFNALQREKESRHRTALATSDDARELGEACAATHVDAARVCFAHEDADDGIRLLLIARTLSATEPSCRLLLARIHEQRGSKSLALRAFREAAEVGEDDAVHTLAVATGLARLGAVDEAESVHRRSIARQPTDAARHAALAQMLLQARRDPVEAERAARRAVELTPLAAYWALVAEACERGGRLAEAVSAAEHAAELEPHHDTWTRLLERLTKR